MSLVDIHCHILPGIDDGSKSWQTSIKLAKAAVRDGVTHAVCTPHTLNGRYLNHKKDVIKLTQEFQEKLDAENIPLVVFPGQEVRISGELPKALDEDDILFLDEEGQYMLLEFPSDDVPAYAKDMIFQVMQRGIIPVVVHPERNSRILKDPSIVQDLIEQGCLIQITASSYLGTFGKEIENLSEQLVEAGQCACFASDAHDLPKREYQYSEALAKLKEKMGEEKAEEFRQNAKAIVNGENVQLNWRPLKKKKRFWLF